MFCLNDRTVPNKGLRFHFTCGESKKKFLSLGKLFKAGSHSRRKALESLETTPKLKKSCEWKSLEEKKPSLLTFSSFAIVDPKADL